MEKSLVIIISMLCRVCLCYGADTLTLQKDEFDVVKDDYIQLFIQIKSPNIINTIVTVPNLTICFEVEKKQYVAIGTYWYDSATPSGCNCTFLKKTQDNTAVMNKDTLRLVKTPPDKKKLREWERVYRKRKPASHFQYEKRHQDHCFDFYSDGTFVEYQWYRNRSDVPCEKGWMVSWGKYEIKSRYYILNSDQNMIYSTQDTIVLTDVQSKHASQDSLFITLNSPYNQLLSVEDTCSSCKYRHQRIFSYDFIIKCGEDKVNKEYEKAFNSKFVADTTGVIRVFKPQEVLLKSVLVKVYWKVDHNDTIIIQTCPSRILKLELKNYYDNELNFNVPSLDYAFLTRTYYTNYLLKRKGSNVIWNNKVFKKPPKYP